MPDYPNRASRNWGTYTYTQRQMIFASAATVMVANMSTPPLPPTPLTSIIAVTKDVELLRVSRYVH